ncbi:hypothetical protein GCM10010269_06310 [Streptomyces humidus]|uniref:Uncharacterized protein n=1 Tax=Streptomyces humidus TaxID=52259 RepID=A0A918L195_9ACTN|nr:hypothetical protein GCM10010269_06310 [Streptomyces humidus]
MQGKTPAGGSRTGARWANRRTDRRARDATEERRTGPRRCGAGLGDGESRGSGRTRAEERKDACGGRGREAAADPVEGPRGARGADGGGAGGGPAVCHAVRDLPS